MGIMAGKFVTFEGGEGVGKSTQVKMLAEKFRADGHDVYVTREPGGGVVGESIRTVLKSFANSMDPLCETLLLFAARRDHYVKIIEPKLRQGSIVICDRFYDSSIVYQGMLKKVPFEDIMILKCMTVGDCEPDITIVLDIDPEISIQRLATRNLIPDEYDMMEKEKHNLIREGFQRSATVFSFRSILVDANGSEKKVFSRIIKAMENSSFHHLFSRDKV